MVICFVTAPHVSVKYDAWAMFSVADLGRENALNLQHSETGLCTLERGFFRNPLSETPLSLKLCTFL
jgi:hypothetical protein